MVVDSLYYAEGKVSSEFTFNEDVLNVALQNIYERTFNTTVDLETDLFGEFWSKLNEATDKGLSNVPSYDPDLDFYHALQNNNAVLSAFKTHRVQSDVAKLLIDSNGNLKPFRQWLNDVRPIAKHQVDVWFETEYNTAVLRANQAARWKQFEAEADVLPNLEWIRSTSPTPGADHSPFWGLILPIEHPHWDNHRPGDRWNCKCDLRATDKEATLEDRIPISEDKDKPAKGLDNNPAKDAKLINDNHPYFPSSCSSCAFNSTTNSPTAYVKRTKKDCYNCSYVKKIIAKNKTKALTKVDEQVLSAFGDKRIEVNANRLETGKLRLTQRIIESYLTHAHTDVAKRFVLELKDRLAELEWNDDFKPLSPIGKSENNFKHKKRRGVVGYSTYDVNINGIKHIIGMEHRGKYEVPYYITKKIKER